LSFASAGRGTLLRSTALSAHSQVFARKEEKLADRRLTGSDLMPVEDKLNLLDRCTG